MNTDGPQLHRDLADTSDPLRELGNATPVMMWTSTADGSLEWFNRHWLEFTGQTQEQAFAAGRLSAIHKDDREPSKLAFEAAFQRRESLQIEYRLQTADGKHCWVVDRAAPRFSNTGEFCGYVGVCMDISDQVKYRQRLTMRESITQQLHSISERERAFFAAAIHDGLLQDVIGADMLVQGVFDLDNETLEERVVQIREILHSAIRHGRRLMSDLRPMILDEQGLAGAVEYYAAEIENRTAIKVQVHADLDHEIPMPSWRGNVFRIIQEALNNVETHSGSKTATVDLRTEDDRLVASVCDQGTGFDLDQYAASFGISCMKDRAEIYGGTVQFESSREGTSVHIEIPLPNSAS